MEDSMNIGKYILTDKYKDWLILTEWNSGFSDHDYHKKLTGFIYSSWKEILKNIEYKDKTFREIGEFDNLISEKTGAILHFSTNFSGKIPLEIGIVISPKFEHNHKNIPVFGAGVNDSDKKMIICALQVNELSTPNNVIHKDSYIRELAAHETVHIIKYFHNIAQKYMTDFEVDGKLDTNAYLRDKHEIDAYISQINEELKGIHEKYQNLLFPDAIKLSDTYNLYKKKIFSYREKIKNKILSKSLHFWINELGGKYK